MASPKYAWVMATCCFFTGIVTMGALTVFGYCMVGISEEFGCTVADLAVVTSIYTCLCNGLAWVAGMIADKLGPRWAMGGGMLINGLGTLLCGLFAGNVGMIIGFLAFAGAGASACVGSVMPKLINNWFAPNSRGKANLFYVLGPSLTGAAYGIVLPILLMSGGWRLVFNCIGGMNVILSLLFLLLCRNSPYDMGTIPFGYTVEEAAMLHASDEKAEALVDTKKVLVKVLKYPATWLFGIAYTCYMCYFATFNTFANATYMWAGVDPVTTGLFNTVTMVVVIFSQILFNSLSDKFWHRKGFLAVLMLAHAVLQFFLYGFLVSIYETGGQFDFGMLLFFMIILAFACGQGGLMNTINVEVFPPSMRAVGPAVVATITIIGASGGPLLGGLIIGMTGDMNYNFIWVTAISEIIGGILVYIFCPKSGGKYGDPRALEEAADMLGGDAVRSAVSSTKIGLEEL